MARHMLLHVLLPEGTYSTVLNNDFKLKQVSYSTIHFRVSNESVLYSSAACVNNDGHLILKIQSLKRSCTHCVDDCRAIKRPSTVRESRSNHDWLQPQYKIWRLARLRYSKLRSLWLGGIHSNANNNLLYQYPIKRNTRQRVCC